MKNYLQLTKPGIVFGNALTAFLGFSVASKGPFNLPLLMAMLVGLSLIIASACVCNNCIDSPADQLMARTRNRPLPSGRLSPSAAYAFAAFLGLAGTLCLALYTPFLTLLLSLLGFAIYVFAYTLSKYKTPTATLIGSFAGALPPVVGYSALTGTWDLTASLLFALIAFWQMPHFFAIALFRQHDYALAGIPVFPLVKGTITTQRHMLFYTGAFAATAALFSPYAGLLSLGWVALSLSGFKAPDTRKWAREMFFSSLFLILSLCFFLCSYS